MELVTSRRILAVSEKALEIRRGEAKVKRKEMDQQWKELEEKEAGLKQSFIKFDKVIKFRQILITLLLLFSINRLVN